jgi:O-6-methylguanine DNA methyltransferase
MAHPTASLVIHTPLGPMALAATDAGLCRCEFLGAMGAAQDPARGPSGGGGGADAARIAAAAAEQLAAYFAGARREFAVPLDLRAGTAFQRAVWGALLAIPFGRTRSYGEVARSLGRRGASRAIGAANGRNPIAIIVPCHRVVDAGGGLHGYGGGLWRKRWLLEHEGAWPGLFAGAAAAAGASA